MSLDPVRVRQELDDDPAGRDYAAHEGNDGEQCDLMNERIFKGRKLVRTGDVEIIARTNFLKPRIAQYAGLIPHLPPPDGTNPGIILSSYLVIDIFSFPDQRLDLDLPAVRGMLDTLQAAGLLDTLDSTGAVLISGADNRAAIEALADTLVSRTEILFGLGIDATGDDISAAYGRI
jgi:hypothetical protein